MNMDFVNHTVLFNNVTKSQSLRKKIMVQWEQDFLVMNPVVSDKLFR